MAALSCTCGRRAVVPQELIAPCARPCPPAVLSGVFTDGGGLPEGHQGPPEEDEVLEQKLQQYSGPAAASTAVSKAELAEVRC